MLEVALELCHGHFADLHHFGDLLFGALGKGVLLVDSGHHVRYANRAFMISPASVGDQACPCFAAEAADMVLKKHTNLQSTHYLVQKPSQAKTVELDVTVSATCFCTEREKVALVIVEDCNEVCGNPRSKVPAFHDMVGRHRKMLHVFSLITDAAPLDVPVLIQGETGTGKELIASAVHRESRRSNKHMITVNCGALAEGVLESELFGHVKGSFTGAFRDVKGRFELAHGGTIFLDEIGDLSPAMQVKLLRVLQNGTYERVGEGQTRRVDARLICATNRDLQEEVAAGRFRADLYYRLGVVTIEAPPLRERGEDILDLIDYLFEAATEDFQFPMPLVDDETIQILRRYSWPGNIRELENCLRSALVRSKGEIIRPRHLPETLLEKVESQKTARNGLDETAVAEALKKTGGNKLRAAALLGISRATLYRFLSDHHVSAALTTQATCRDHHPNCRP